jgi:N6-adenosine-specific RNA methylase IME4
VTIKIDPEFRDLIPSLSDEELSQLEANIKAEGCRDPLVVWNGTLLDGHNRYEICERLDVSFDTVNVELYDRESAIDWIERNQIGRRNLTADQRRYFIGRVYNRRKKARGAPVGNENRSVQRDQNEPFEKTADKVASDFGVSAPTVKRAAKFAEEVDQTPQLKQAVQSGASVLETKRAMKERAREERRAGNKAVVESVKKPTELVGKARFATIVIDPPWDWGDEGDVNQMGRAKPDYSTMSIDDLSTLPVSDLADDDCHLYLWITNRSLPKGFRLMEAWGFRYITAITWVKPSFGMGNYFRGQTEHVLFGVKGSQSLKRRDVGTVFEAPRGGKHSEKPELFYDIVESCSPGPYIELFSRSDRDGWTMWGQDT